MNPLLAEVESIVGPLLEESGVELVDCTYQKGPGGWTLCFYLDKSGGFSLSDCEEWSGRIGSLLDERDLIPHTYSLEVSSPGLARPLKKTSDFQRFIGERVQVRLFAPQDGRKNFSGALIAADEQNVTVHLADLKADVVIDRTKIAKATLDPDIHF